MPITRAYGQASQLGNTPAASNPVINGAFDIWQRGTTISSAANVYSADRWLIYRSGANLTTSRVATGDTTNLPNIQYAAQLQRTASSTNLDVVYFVNMFETVNSIPFAGKTVTLSYYARAGANYSPTGSSLTAQIQTGTGTDQNWISGYTGVSTPLTANATLTTTWQRFTVTGTIAATATELSVIFSYTPTGTAGANDWVQITGVQIDIGSVALPFRRNSATLAGELAACQRYYYRWNADTADAHYGNGFGISTTAAYIQFALPVPMRVVPSAIEVSGIRIANGSAPFTGGTWAIVRNHTLSPVLSYSGTSGLAANNFYQGNANATTQYLGFTAEL